ncbi:MAG: NAD(P)-dependent oxidoreductase [Sphingobacteriales bacterium]|jgi:saccharopine dehydrogenase (NAD+, L-lysine-forming)
MIILGLIREDKVPADNRVALTPSQCKWLQNQFSDIKIVVQSSFNRCYSNKEYQMAGVTISDDIQGCDILLGIKEVPAEKLLENKTYLFFSHTKKLQPNNQKMFQTIIQKKSTLIDYECMEHEDGTRIIGFGFFAGIVGAHNGIMCYGERTGLFHLERVYTQRSFRELIHSYFGLKLPNLKIAVTGSGRVAHGVLEIMNLMGIHEVEPDQYLSREFQYPVYVQLKGADLYAHKEKGTYSRDHFHDFPEQYTSIFKPYLAQTDILMNGVYWDKQIPRLFEKKDVTQPSFRIKTISDITDDIHGSIPINYGDQDIFNPVYGVDRTTLEKTAPYLPNSTDIIAVGNLPNELPRDASRYFGEQLIKHILPKLLQLEPDDGTLKRATLIQKGEITSGYSFMKEYGYSKI